MAPAILGLALKSGRDVDDVSDCCELLFGTEANFAYNDRAIVNPDPNLEFLVQMRS